MRTRLAVFAVLATLVALLTLLDRAAPSSSVAVTARAVGPVIPPAGASGSTWYCAAASATTSAHPSHELVISNPTTHDVTAELTAVTARAAAPVTVAVGRRATVVVPSGVADASYIVELSRPGPVVSHRLTASGGLMDEAPCATSGGERAFFPAADTQTAQGADAELWLFNPFPSDASLDVSVVTEDGVRTPGALSGIVVPGSSTLMVDLGKVEQRREQFALSVVTRAGLVVTDLTQVTTSPAGLRLVPGIERTSTRLVFADGRSGMGLAERYVVYNPSSDDATVLLSVLPFDAAQSALPVPFELDVPARSYVVTQVDRETRVVQDQLHWVRLESINGVGVAVERVSQVTGAGNGYSLTSGSASSAGQSAQSTAWVTPWADRSADATSAIVVANPSVDTIAKVRITAFGAGAVAKGTAVKTAEIGPGHSAEIDLGPSGPDPRGLVVTSSSPVVVERRVLAGGADDLAVVAAVPSGPLTTLPPMSHTAAGG